MLSGRITPSVSSFMIIMVNLNKVRDTYVYTIIQNENWSAHMIKGKDKHPL